MAKEQTKLDLVIGAWDRFSGPLAAFAQKVEKAGAAVNKFKAQAEGVGNATGFTRLSSAAGNFGSSLLKVGDKAGAVFGRIAGAAGKLSLLLGGAGGGVLALATSVGAAGENMGIFAQKAGVAIESFQKLAYGASFSNIQTEEMAVMLGKLGNQIQQTAFGNEDLQKAFKAAGVAVKDSSGKLKNADQVMLELSDTFAKMQDGPTKNALAIKIFGEEGMKLLPFLNQGSEALRQYGKDAERLGIVFDKGASSASGDFNKALGDVQYALKGLGYTIGLDVMPVVQGVLGEFKEWVVANRVLIGQNVRQWVEGFAQRLPDIVQGMRDVGNGISSALGGLGKLSDMLGGADNLMLAAAAVMSGPLFSALYGAGAAFVSLGVAIMTTPVGWIMAAVAAIAGGAYLIIKHWDKVAAFFNELGAALPAIFADFTSVFSDLGAAIGGVFSDAWETVSGFFGKLSGLMPDWLKRMFSGSGSGSGPKVAFESGMGAGFAPAGMAPAGMAAQMAQSHRGVNTSSTTTRIERSEIVLNAGPGVSIQGGEHAKGVQVNQSHMGFQRNGD